MSETATLSNATLDPELRRILAAARDALNGGWLAGGAVRDLLLGRMPIDLDFVAAGDSQAAAEALASALGASVFALDEARGNYRIVIEHGATIDVTPLHEGGIEADLRRRDFTINALAAPLLPDGALGDVIDVTGGLQDLGARRVCMTSDAALREDPLRLLRAVRFAVELEMTIEDATAAAIRTLAPGVTSAAGERQRDELLRVFDTPRASAGVRLMDELGLLSAILPELDAGRGVDQPFAHHWDVFHHAVETVAALDEMLATKDVPSQRPWLRASFRETMSFYDLDAYLDDTHGGASRRAVLKLAGLLHDVAKPETKTLEANGRARFFGHPERGAETAIHICERLRFGGRETSFIARLIEAHLRPTQLSNSGLPTKRAVYKFFRDLGDAAPACLILALADTAGATGPKLTPDRWRGVCAYAAYVLREGTSQNEVVAAKPRLITGEDVMRELDVAPGPALGRMLAAIDEAIATGEVTSRDDALALARSLLAQEQRS